MDEPTASMHIGCDSIREFGWSVPSKHRPASGLSRCQLWHRDERSAPLALQGRSMTTPAWQALLRIRLFSRGMRAHPLRTLGSASNDSNYRHSQGKNMKRSILIAVALSAVLVGCGKQEPPKPAAPAPAPVAAPEPAPAPAPTPTAAPDAAPAASGPATDSPSAAPGAGPAPMPGADAAKDAPKK
jgi:hypothetical protein